jgi:hypothetical protein
VQDLMEAHTAAFQVRRVAGVLACQGSSCCRCGTRVRCMNPPPSHLPAAPTLAQQAALDLELQTEWQEAEERLQVCG